ncbi:MAG: hypothetical protein DRQ39_05330 [Gammaproteobacteria bacterium]|nr:MAG: hypothetical protein DRQ39_05330 [Gammaproteobacteria bacterium]
MEENYAFKMEDYLGDGVYATFDGYAITLDLRGQDCTTVIVLDPEVVKRFINFNNRVEEVKNVS